MAVRYIVLLSLQTGERDAFNAYEKRAATIMARHGGRLVDAYILEGESDPGECHILEFRDEAGFAAYRADLDLAALAGKRAACIRDTQIFRAAPNHALNAKN